jgi:hypothetical protein
MPDSLIFESESNFVCDCEEWMLSACAGEPFYQVHAGRRYCVLHFPGKEKSADFQKVFQRKLDSTDFNFRGVWFPDELAFSKFDFGADADFQGATFISTANFVASSFGGRVDFFRAVFTAEASFANAVFTSDIDFYEATFAAEADFRAVTFSAGTEFRRVTFGGAANFRYATFSAKANFRSSTFSAIAVFDFAGFGAAADFSEATFSAAASFRTTTFSGDAEFINCTLGARTDFWNVIFKGDVNFEGNETTAVFGDTSSLNLQFARIAKPDHLSFHTLVLRPSWFVNVDASNFLFTNVEWRQRSINGEIKSVRDKGVSSPHFLLAIAFRQLAVNAEDNHRFEEASMFRYMAMDVRRRERWRGLAFWRLSWWYWLASGYGERVLQAFLVSLAVLVLFAVLYVSPIAGGWEPRSNGSVGDVNLSTRFATALTYSAGVMTLQKPDPRPTTPAAQTLVLLETIFGPVQVALLALAIRRKFMR